jgi:hypothetical protein
VRRHSTYDDSDSDGGPPSDFPEPVGSSRGFAAPKIAAACLVSAIPLTGSLMVRGASFNLGLPASRSIIEIIFSKILISK